MSEALLETTVWEDNTPNHTYLFDGDRALAYIKSGSSEVIRFSKPMQVSKRYRTFKKVSADLFGIMKSDTNVIEVMGSKGEVYQVNKADWSCTCKGWSFRGTCKHVGIAKGKQSV
jgi:hypothetical protein